jgi:two-component system sensor kinase FixL
MFSRETRALMEAAVDAIIVIDHRGRVLSINDAVQRMFGYRTDELLGENVSMLMPEPDRGNHDQYLANYLHTGVARIIGHGRQVVARRKDGTLFPAYLSVGRIPDSGPPRFVGLVHDTTAEHEAISLLKMERDRANAYLELNDAVLMSLGPDRRVLEVNGRGSELLGMPKEEIQGRDWMDFFTDEYERERARVLLDSALTNDSSREREFDAIVHGEPRRIYWRCIARRQVDGTSGGWLCSGLDVTDRLHREVHATLAQDRVTRVASLTAMGEMAAGIAHELNQPLGAITAYASACKNYLASPQPDYEALREAVREIGTEGERAARLIGRIVQLARGDQHDTRVSTDVNELVEELRVLLTTDARVFDTRLRIALTPNLPRVDANPAQLQQVILNLARNAFEALAENAPGERELTISTARTADGSIEVLVFDNGPGVSPAVKDRLFHPFTTTKKSGTGLGLTISDTVARAHGGTIALRPQRPHGAGFALRLPCREEVPS